jgi:hypothetical protein
VKTLKSRENPKQSILKLSQICRRIELCIREITLRFENLLFFLTAHFIFVILSKYISTSLLGCRDPWELTVHHQRQSYHFITAVKRIIAISVSGNLSSSTSFRKSRILLLNPSTLTSQIFQNISRIIISQIRNGILS